MAGMPDWFSDWLATVDWPIAAQVLVAIGTLVLAAFTYSLARATRRLADEAVAAREAEEQPRLVVYTTYGDTLLQLVIENTGRRNAAGTVVTAEYDGKVYDLLRYQVLVNGSEIPGGTTVRRNLANHMPGVRAAAYSPLSVQCRWRWVEHDRDLEAAYTIHPGVALPFQ